MGKTLRFLVGIAILYTGLSFSVSALEVPLQFEKADTGESRRLFYGYGNGLFRPEKPDGKWAFPSLNTDKPLYSTLRLGDKPILLVLDTEKSGDKYYNRLWADSDGDGELQNEKPLALESVKKGNLVSTLFGRRVPGHTDLDLKITVDGKLAPYFIRLNIKKYTPSKYFTGAAFSYQIACGYTGTFQVGGTHYTVTLCDRNGNGRFDDRVVIPDIDKHEGFVPLHAKGDVVYLASGGKKDIFDGTTLGDLLLLKDTLYIQKVDLSRGKLILEPVKGGLSPLKLPMRPEHLSLASEDGRHCLNIYQPSGDVIHIPAGRYRLLNYLLLRRDEQGDLWRLAASGTFNSPVFEVVKGAGAVLTAGEPYLPYVDFQPGEIKQLNGYFIFRVSGQGKEIMTGLSRIEGNATRIPLSAIDKQEPREPSYTIIKPDGEIVAKGSFEYG